MEQITIENGFGFAVDFNDNDLADKLYKWYMLTINKHDTKYNQFFDFVLEEDREFENKFIKFLKS
jgi:hypothetical protein